jgi:hypothetical protein
MAIKIYNYSPNKFRGMIKLLRMFLPFAKEELGFDKDPVIKLLDRELDKAEILGKTAFYDPEKMIVSVYTHGRHPKDIMRSISHELVHHLQACRGDLTGFESTEEGYAQKDAHMNEMEREAYEKGNMCFRKWEDSYKEDPQSMKKYLMPTDVESQPLQENPMKSLNEWKNEEIFGMLMERFVPTSKKRLVEEVEALDEVEIIDEEEDPEDSKELSPKQKKIASAAPPPNKITGEDFAELRKNK